MHHSRGIDARIPHEPCLRDTAGSSPLAPRQMTKNAHLGWAHDTGVAGLKPVAARAGRAKWTGLSSWRVWAAALISRRESLGPLAACVTVTQRPALA